MSFALGSERPPVGTKMVRVMTNGRTIRIDFGQCDNHAKSEFGWTFQPTGKLCRPLVPAVSPESAKRNKTVQMEREQKTGASTASISSTGSNTGSTCLEKKVGTIPTVSTPPSTTTSITTTTTAHATCSTNVNTTGNANTAGNAITTGGGEKRKWGCEDASSAQSSAAGCTHAVVMQQHVVPDWSVVFGTDPTERDVSIRKQFPKMVVHKGMGFKRRKGDYIINFKPFDESTVYIETIEITPVSTNSATMYS